LKRHFNVLCNILKYRQCHLKRLLVKATSVLREKNNKIILLHVHTFFYLWVKRYRYKKISCVDNQISFLNSNISLRKLQLCIETNDNFERFTEVQFAKFANNYQQLFLKQIAQLDVTTPKYVQTIASWLSISIRRSICKFVIIGKFFKANW
jgi:hypothetical protein